MRSLFYILISFISANLFAGSCCIGSGPRSFVQLKHLQSYDLGVATSFKDVYGKFNPYGDLTKSAKTETYTLALGGAFRLTPRTEIYGLVPFVQKSADSAFATKTSSHLGDVSVGVKAQLYDAIFDEEWIPNIRLLTSIKFPTGTQDSVDSTGQVSPGTGNGIWEPSLGLQLQRDIGFAIGTVSGTYTRRFQKTVQTVEGSRSVKEGDRFELMEGATLPLTELWSITAGSTQAWDLSTSIDGESMSDSHGRVISGFASTTYFLNRFWTATLGFESALPIDKLSHGEEAYRTVTLSTTYAIY